MVPAPEAAERAPILGQPSRGATSRNSDSPKFAMARAAMPMFSANCGSTSMMAGARIGAAWSGSVTRPLWRVRKLIASPSEPPRPRSKLVQSLPGVGEDGAGLLGLLGAEVPVPHALEKRATERLNLADERDHSGSAGRFVDLRLDAREVGLVLLQISPTCLGDGEQALVAGHHRRDKVGLLQHLKHRIDRAGAGAVGPRKPLFERLDDVVAVPGLLGDQAEHDEPQRALIEHSGPAASAERTAAVLAERSAVGASTAASPARGAAHKPASQAGMTLMHVALPCC